MDTTTFYSKLFHQIQTDYGPLDETTVTSVTGFTAGGPVSVLSIESKGLYVTCELALHPNQHVSAEGLKFELGHEGAFSLEECREIFTALGDLSLGCQLGDGHTVGLSGVYDGTVQLNLYSRNEFEGQWYGVYFVSPVNPAAQQIG